MRTVMTMAEMDGLNDHVSQSCNDCLSMAIVCALFRAAVFAVASPGCRRL